MKAEEEVGGWGAGLGEHSASLLEILNIWAEVVNIKNNNNTEGSLSIRLHFHPCSFIICSFVHGYTNLGPIGV